MTDSEPLQPLDSEPAADHAGAGEPRAEEPRTVDLDETASTETVEEIAAPDVVWPDSEEHRLLRLEAVLFLARDPMNSRKLSHFADLEDGTQARTLIKKLNSKYDEQGRSFHVKRVAGGYQLMTRPQFSSWLRKREHGHQSLRLSTPAMETLAVVAYRQPVLKAEIESIRGVSSGELLRQLLEKNLVRISGRSPELGNPYLYSTTKRFLESFGLANLEALPRANKLRGRGIPDWNQEHQNSQITPTDPLETDEIAITNEEGSP